jgi:hypothetical protein
MRIKAKKSVPILVFCLMATLIITSNLSQADTATSKNNMLAFLRNVVNIDLSSYNVTLISAQEPYNVLNSANQEQIRYKLQNSNGTLDATCLFQNNALVWFMMSFTGGTPALIEQPSNDPLTNANAVLDNYMKYTGSKNIQSKKDLLNTVNSAKDTTISNGNLKLTISTGEFTSQFDWINTYNGATGPGFSFEFYKGILVSLDDHESTFTIGSASVKVDQINAINIAVDRLKNFTWSISSGPAKAENVTKFTLLTDNAAATLSMQVREDLTTLYPMWRVEIPVDQIYVGDKMWSGSPTSIAVGIWADTGVINYCQELSYGGSSQSIQTDTQSDNSAGWLYLALMAGAVVAATLIVVTSVVLKKRTK